MSQITPIFPKALCLHCHSNWESLGLHFIKAQRWWTQHNLSLQERNECYERTMSIGVGLLGRLRLKLSIATQQMVFWLLSGCLAVIEVLTMRVLI